MASSTPTPKLNVPAGVTPKLVQDLEAVQRQIWVLVNNHKILRARIRKNPKDKLLPKQLAQVETFLLEFNEKQAPILAEIRREVSELKRKEAEAEAVATDKIPVKDESGSEEDEKRTAEDQSLPTVEQEPPDVDDDKEVLGGESLNKPEAEEPKVGEGKDQVEEETPKGDVKEEPQDGRHQEVPAKVEGQGQDENVESQGQDEKAEGSVAAVKTESEERQSRSPSSESSPSETAAVAAPPLQEEETTATGGIAVEQDQEDDDDWTVVLDPEEELKPGQFRAHVSDVEPFQRLRSEDGDRFIAEPYPLPDRPEVRSTEASHDDYLRNLGIIREADQKRLRDHYSGARDMRNGIRYKTFIPDYCSEPKKQRLNYGWLSSCSSAFPDVSPPMLRTRGGRNRNVAAAASGNGKQAAPPRRRTNDEIAADEAAAASVESAATALLLQDRKKRKRRPPAALMDGLEMPLATVRSSASTSRASTPEQQKEVVHQQQESPPMIEETQTEPDVKYEVLDVVEEDIDDPSADIRDPSTTALEPPASQSSQSSSDGGPLDQSQSAEGSVTTSTPSGSQSDGTPPAKPLTPRTSERKRKATEKIRQSKLQKGKEDLETELRRLDSKSEGLRAQIDGTGLTIATRKERMRKTELMSEREDLERRAAQIRLILSRYST